MNKIEINGVLHSYDDNILCIDKPGGMTSFGVVKTVRRLLGIRKVGHAGTLDPLATGLLIVCTGKATKRTGEFMSLAKEYEAVAVLGKRTNTYDAMGDVTSESEVPRITKEDLSRLSEKFTGNILQVPPMFSALKLKGKPLYRFARKGEDFPREPRNVMVYEFEIKWVELPRFAMRVVCGKGTYIRSLVHDIGETVGCGAYVEALRRTKIGDFSVGNALSLEGLESQMELLAQS